MRFTDNYIYSSVIPKELVNGYCELAQKLVAGSVRQYEDFFVLPHDVQVAASDWKLLRRKAELNLYKQNLTKQAQPYQLLQTLNGDEPIYTKNPTPIMMVTGHMEGDLHDSCFGAHVDSTESLRKREKYTGEDVLDSQVLQQLRGPSSQDPFHFTGIIWIIFTGSFLPVVRRRDAVFLHSVGRTRNSKGEFIGYSLYHCVKLPSVPPFPSRKLKRIFGSYCFLRRQMSPYKMDVYMKGWLTPFGETAEFSVPSGITNFLFASQNTVRVSYVRKLLLHIIKCQTQENYKRASEM